MAGKHWVEVTAHFEPNTSAKTTSRNSHGHLKSKSATRLESDMPLLPVLGELRARGNIAS
jgi:hypothetical protein